MLVLHASPTARSCYFLIREVLVCSTSRRGTADRKRGPPLWDGQNIIALHASAVARNSAVRCIQLHVPSHLQRGSDAWHNSVYWQCIVDVCVCRPANADPYWCVVDVCVCRPANADPSGVLWTFVCVALRTLTFTVALWTLVCPPANIDLYCCIVNVSVSSC